MSFFGNITCRDEEEKLSGTFPLLHCQQIIISSCQSTQQRNHDREDTNLLLVEYHQKVSIELAAAPFPIA